MKFILTIIFFIISTYANADENLEITNNIRSVCMAPDKKGEYWDVDTNIDTKVKVKLLGIKTDIQGNFSKGEWDGVQKVLKNQQAKEHKNYRECVKYIAPLFLSPRFKQSKKTESKKNIKKGVIYSLKLNSYEIGDIAEAFGSDLLVLQRDGKRHLAGYSDNGTVIIEDLELSNNFEVKIDMDLSKFDTVISFQSNDENSIEMSFKDKYIKFGNTKKIFDKTSWEGGLAINTVKILVRENTSKAFVNGKFFATNRINGNSKYHSLLIRKIKKDDSIFNISIRNLK